MADNLPKLSPQCRRSYNEFVSKANKVALHAYDWDRYYRFIVELNRVSSPLLGFEIKKLLVNSGFPEDVASMLANVYDHGRAIIRKYKGATFAYPGQHPHELRDELRRQLTQADSERKHQ